MKGRIPENEICGQEHIAKSNEIQDEKVEKIKIKNDGGLMIEDLTICDINAELF